MKTSTPHWDEIHLLSQVYIHRIGPFRALGRFFPECRRPPDGSEMAVLFGFCLIFEFLDADKKIPTSNMVTIMAQELGTRLY